MSVLPANLDFRGMLDLASLDPREVVAVRHAPQQKALRRVLPWLVVERPELFMAWQQIQWEKLEKALMRARYMASFVGQDSGMATFAGISRITGWQSLDHAAYLDFPGNRELADLGMDLRGPDMEHCLAFELEETGCFADYVGRLVVNWPTPSRQWWRWAGNASFPVSAIDPDSRFVRAMPEWSDLILSWYELQSLPASWISALAQWRGVYLIHDVERRAGYVGSAYGEDNILGRWRGYARTGHGGNVALRQSNPANLRFSILQRTSPDLEPADVIALEASWKNRLHTREAGLNRN
ncbi:GIY-YIG nuclease family protein [Novosphingobium flavum]|uniref:GIY-YIG nuclease family protein n=1 Tax=Novosphingobium flavum TaxID=1778672 RepID=A0A7X1KN95_9SPHN|nr:GIY-YIG nuclease family protein [Novosphingobium flavum]MBC2667198.1 GIY-YIG nuclease family protein [Novosphingobium flavum]